MRWRKGHTTHWASHARRVTQIDVDNVSSGKEEACPAQVHHWNAYTGQDTPRLRLTALSYPIFYMLQAKNNSFGQYKRVVLLEKKSISKRYIYPHTTTEQILFELPTESRLSSSSKQCQLLPLKKIYAMWYIRVTALFPDYIVPRYYSRWAREAPNSGKFNQKERLWLYHYLFQVSSFYYANQMLIHLHLAHWSVSVVIS